MVSANAYAIILADDHAMFRGGIKRIISQEPSLKVVGEASDGCEVLGLLKGFIPDLVILDISMPKCGGMEAGREIKRLYPGLKVLFLSLQRDLEYLRRAMDLGAEGYLLKEAAADELLDAIFTLMEGKTYFSPIPSKYEPAEFSRVTPALP
jgi:DNA-binding NarL/FixJ family response regulator